MTRNGIRLGALVMAGVLLGLGAREDALPDDLALVPGKALLVSSVRVAELWNGELGQDLRKALGKEADRITADFRSRYGQGPGELERLTTFALDLPRGEEFALALRFAKKLDSDKVLAQNLPDGRDEKVARRTVRVAAGKAAFVAADGRTLVVGNPRFVRKLLEEKPTRPTGALAAMLAKAAKHPVAVFIDPRPVAEFDTLPPALAAARPLLQATDGVAWLDVGYTSKFGLKMTFKDDKAAGRGRKAIDAARALASLTLAGASESLAAVSKPLAGLVPKVEKALDDATVEQKGTAVEAALELKLERAAMAGVIKEAVAKFIVGSNRDRSVNNLRQIGLAMHNYESATGSLPPAAVYDKDGKALLSWRVAILPYVGQDALYKQFKLNEPWDSEHNKKLIAKIPPVYVVPDGKPSAAGGTFYQVFLGKMAGFEGKRGIKLGDIVDGTSNTIMAVEAAKDVPWTKPDDLPFDLDGKLPNLGGHFEGGFNALFFDGSVRFISNAVKPETLTAMITRNGGEGIGDE